MKDEDLQKVYDVGFQRDHLHGLKAVFDYGAASATGKDVIDVRTGTAGAVGERREVFADGKVMIRDGVAGGVHDGKHDGPKRTGRAIDDKLPLGQPGVNVDEAAQLSPEAQKELDKDKHGGKGVPADRAHITDTDLNEGGDGGELRTSEFDGDHPDVLTADDKQPLKPRKPKT